MCVRGRGRACVLVCCYYCRRRRRRCGQFYALERVLHEWCATDFPYLECDAVILINSLALRVLFVTQIMETKRPGRARTATHERKLWCDWQAANRHCPPLDLTAAVLWRMCARVMSLLLAFSLWPTHMQEWLAHLGGGACLPADSENPRSLGARLPGVA
jgi:hypothetical protein|eukprot:SAG25_NODE_2240_length_1805_cov_2.093787_2_plen_159_part_00